MTDTTSPGLARRITDGTGDPGLAHLADTFDDAHRCVTAHIGLNSLADTRMRAITREAVDAFTHAAVDPTYLSACAASVTHMRGLADYLGASVSR